MTLDRTVANVKAVTHVHTTHSWDSRTQVIATVDELERIGAGLALITDHNSYAGARDCRAEADRRQLPIRIPTAAEVRTDRGDVIVVFDHDAPPSIESLLVWEDLVCLVREAGGLIWLPHPYHGHDEVEDLAVESDVVEVFNARCSDDQNARASELCRRSGSVPGYGFDAHRLAELDRFSVFYPDGPSVLEQLRSTPTCDLARRTRKSDIAAAEVAYGLHRRSMKKIGYFSAKWVFESARERVDRHVESRIGRAEPGVSGRVDPAALVLGDIDLVTSLHLAGIRVAAATRGDRTVRMSHIPFENVEVPDGWSDPIAVVETIELVARDLSSPPTLIHGHDEDVLLLADHGERLARSVHFVAPDPELARDLVDKSRFIDLSARLDLPVPPSAHLRCRETSPPRPDEVEFPLIAKPATREPARWMPVAGRAKAMRFDTPAELDEVWDDLQEADADIIVQTFLPGPESDIVSYHVYVDAGGRIAAEFSGRKIRTLPAEYGHTTALEITAEPEILKLGKELVERLGLTGVAKFDFKPDGHRRLRLLEVNPRFSLWHHPAAVAGVNIPAMVVADCNGIPRPKATLEPGVVWCNPLTDVLAARAQGGSVIDSLRLALRADSHHALSRRDPRAGVGLLVKVADSAVAGRRGHAESSMNGSDSA